MFSTWLRDCDTDIFVECIATKTPMYVSFFIRFIGIVYEELAQIKDKMEYKQSHCSEEMWNWNERDLLGKCAKYSQLCLIKLWNEMMLLTILCIVCIGSNTHTHTYFPPIVSRIVQLLHLTCQQSAKTHVNMLYARSLAP